MLAHSFSTAGGLRRCLLVSTHTGAQLQLQNIFKVLKKLQASMPHATPKELALGDYPDPDIEVSLIQQRERFKRSLARVEVLDILKSAGWVLLPACRQRPARWSDANNTNASTNGSYRRLIPVHREALVLANCTDTLTAPMLPDRCARFPLKKACSGLPISFYEGA